MSKITKADQGQLSLDFEQRAMARGIARAEAANYRDVALAREIAREIYLAGCLPISADDVREAMLRRWPDTKFGNWMGSVFKTSEWQSVGFILSRTAGRHRSTIRTWALKDV